MGRAIQGLHYSASFPGRHGSTGTARFRVSELNFSSLPRDIIASRLFRLFQPAKIIFTIRKQEDYVSSMYLNLKRNSAFFSQMPVPPLSRWYRGMLSQLRCHYLQNIVFYEAISIYERLFGRQNILVLPLERLIFDGPKRYLQDLCTFAGLDLSDDDVDRYAQP